MVKFIISVQKDLMKTGMESNTITEILFDSNGIRYSGVKKISGKYYYFSDKGVLRTKTVKVGNTIYYCTEKGILEAWKKERRFIIQMEENEFHQSV